MRKSVLSIALCMLCAFAASADPSMPGLPGSGSGMTGGGSSGSGPSMPPVPTGSSSNKAFQMNNDGTVENPVAPATLLLLGLAGGFAGLKIYNNTKKKNEEDYE